ncbi:MAG: hypothetical protein ACXWVI_06250, partial [Methyloceanibacter sp.]
MRTCLDASQSFLDKTLSRLGRHLLETFPDFEARFGPIDKLRAVPRYGPRARNEVGMDAQIVVNSPPLVDGTKVRGPHLDVPNKLISALLYLRREDDDSVGGSWPSTPAGGEVLFNEVNGVVRGSGAQRAVLSLPAQSDDPTHGDAARLACRQPAGADQMAALPPAHCRRDV